MPSSLPSGSPRSPMGLPRGRAVRDRGEPRVVLVLVALGCASAAGVSLVAARAMYLGGLHNRFLLWNLTLAWIPAVCAYVAHRLHLGGRPPAFLVAMCAVVWFFFFPNAPYLVTDFVHLQHEPPVPLWFDLLTIAMFAWTGLCLGYLSLYLMQEIVRAQMGRVQSWLFAVVMLAVGSIGIYAGRFLRWNSWDVVRDPKGIVRGSLKLVEDADGQLGVVAYVCVTFLFLLTTYFSTIALTRLRENSPA